MVHVAVRGMAIWGMLVSVAYFPHTNDVSLMC